MGPRQGGTVIILALIAGFAGGVVGTRVAPADLVIAEETASRSQIVTVQRLVITDRDGIPRAYLAVSETGEPSLDFVNQQGQSVASFGLTPGESPELRLNAADGAPRMRLALLEKGEPRLDFTMEKDGKSLASLGLSAQGWPDLRLSGKDGKAATSLLFTDGEPQLLLQDRKGQANAVLAATSGKASLALYRDGTIRANLALEGLDLVDVKGRARFQAQLSDAGEPRLAMKDNEGHRMIGLSVQPMPKKEEPLIALYDRQDTLRVGLNLDEAGRPNLLLRERPLLSLIDKTGEDGIFLSLERGNRPSILVSSKKARHSAFLGLRDNNEMALDFLDDTNKQRASLSLDPEGEPSMQLRDKKGQVIWSVARDGGN